MTTWLQDFRYGARLLARTPGFTLMAVAALAIGIGANTAIFSVLNTLILQPPPYRDPGRLAIIWEHNIPRDRKNNVVGPANFLHWQEMNHTFEEMAALTLSFTRTLTGAGEPEQIPIKLVNANFFRVLGVAPAIGRTFTAAEDQPNSRFVVLSDRLWRRRFNADPGILQRTITLQGDAYTVLGVMPPGFSFLDDAVDLWSPIGFSAQSRTPRGRSLTVVGRLKPGVAFEAAQRDMTQVGADLTRMFPDFNTGWTVRVVSLQEQLTGEVRPALFVLLGAVAFVLLIACANVANLLLARATTRQRELAVRAALGAARGRLVRQLLAESLLIAVTGGAVGLALAWWGVRALRVTVADRLPVPRLEAVAIDGWVLAFTLGASVLSGLFFGLVPALSASSARLSDALKEGGRTGSAARGARTRGTFVVVEVALALVLLIGAGLLVRSFMRLLAVDAGFDPSRTVSMRLSLPASRYPNNAAYLQFYERLFERIEALPTVQGAGGISSLPLSGLGAATTYAVIGAPAPPKGQEPVTDVRVITHDYFKAMGVRLLRGRVFNERDTNDLTKKVIINEAMARKHWPGEDPLGKRVKIHWDEHEDEVIGVVADVRGTSLDTAARSMTYWPYARNLYASMTLTVRTSGDPARLASAVVRVIHEQDPNLAVADVRTMEEVVSRSVAQRRLMMLLLAMFAGAALLLAALGIHGVIAYSVTQRTQEIGIRMALGAQGGDVLRMIVGQAVLLAAMGVVIGGVLALAMSNVMEGLLYEVTPLDPLTYAAVTAVLAGVAALAAWLPGRRATRVDPVIALRAE